jgi:hypothetical protein
MPLIHSGSKEALHKNMHVLMGEIGKSPHVKSRAQAIAIALETQRRNRAAGGGVAGYDMGGGVDPVNAVITALTQGAQQTTSGTSGMGSTNPAAPSSPQQTMATTPAPTPAMPQPPVASPAATSAPVGTNPAVGVAPAVNPMQKPLMARGGVPGLATGGFDMAHGPMLRPSWEERSAARNLMHGPVLSSVPGRTDNHQVQVASGSYVYPAAHVAAVGHGNTLAGMNIISRMYGMGPYGTAAPKMGHASIPHPRPPKMPTFRDGGSHGAEGFVPVPVNISGGEVVVPPWAIIRKHGSLKAGHAAMDKWVMETRKKEIKTLRKLPPPAKR